MQKLRLLTVLVISAFVFALQAQEPATQDVTGIDTIFFAATIGDLEAVKKHLEAGADINGRDPNFGASVLAAAVVRNQVETAKYLIENGADVNQASQDGSTPLHTAALFGFAESAELLIDSGADIFARGQGGSPSDITNADWETTLYIASIIQLDVNEEDVMAGREKVRELLGERLNELAYENPFIAILTNNLEALQTSLAKSDGDLNQHDPQSGAGLLTMAAISADGQIAEVLLEAGADPNFVGQDGGTPLHAAVFFGKADIVKALLAHGAKKDTMNNDGATPLDVADLDLETTAYLAGMAGIEIDGVALLEGRAKIKEMLTAE